MITVEQLTEMIEEETADAMKYAKCALACQDDKPLAEMFIQLSDEEMKHMARLHERLRAMYKEA